MKYYAHSLGLDKSKWQSIKEHLINTSTIAFELGRDSGLSEFGQLAALFHDIGKYSQGFQKRLSGYSTPVDHSTAGAKEIIRLVENENQNQKAIATLLAYCIAGHHCGLPDYGSVIDHFSEPSLCARLKRNLDDYSTYKIDIDLSNIVLPKFLPIKPNPHSSGFSISFFTRMIYSILVDADFIETESFMLRKAKPRGGYPTNKDLIGKLNQHLLKFNHPSNPIDKKRTETLQNCIDQANQEPGFFTLTVPTGGGKTLSSMAFALNHAVKHNLKRIIYVIPYTSIIDQNASIFKECLGNENVLEHHSNFDWKEKGIGNKFTNPDDQDVSILEKLKLASENWDIPVIVTTNVQFFESLFSNRSSRCRKIHNIAKSVIIFDEAQMLPRRYIKACMYAVFELIRNYGSSAVFCTATQPIIQKFLPPGTKLTEIASNPQDLYQFYKRVSVNNAGKLNDQDLIQLISQHPQILCIVNTRKHAKGLFQLLIADSCFHLSTLMCPVHRKKTIATIKNKLKARLECRVISTQIMEAGIDIDFPVGYRALAGLDSIVQAAGRVNREGKLQNGEINIFIPDSIFIKQTPAYIQQGAEVANNILRKFNDPISIEAIKEYYDLLYDIQGDHAFDEKGILYHFEKGIQNEMNFDFKTAAENFNLIDNATVSIIIPFDKNANTLLKHLRSAEFPQSFSRSLQPYTVNIYEQEYQALLSNGLIDIYVETYPVLNNPNYYDNQTGLIIPEMKGGKAIFFDG